MLNEKTQDISIVIDEVDIIYCANAQIMKDFVNEHSNVWYEDLSVLRKNYVALKRKIDDYKLKFQKIKNDLHIFQKELDQINATITRLRECRDEYRSQVQKNIDAFQELRRNWDKLRAQLRKIEQKNQILKDNIETRLSSRLVYNSEDEKSNINDDLYDDLAQQFHERAQRDRDLMNKTYLNRELNSFQSKSFHESRYKNVENFYDDVKKWKLWRLALMFKLNRNWKSFLIERSRIEYARDVCKVVAFDIIEFKVDLNVSNCYITLDELLRDLETIFDEKNRYQNNLITLQNKNFKMRTINKNEIFDQYIIRFNFIVSALNFIEEFKKFFLSENLITALRFKFANFVDILSFNEMCDKLRRLEHSHRRINKNRREKINRNQDSRKLKFIVTFKSNERSNRDVKNNINVQRMKNEFSSTQKNVMKKFNFYYKCDKFDHRSKQINAFCKNKSSITRAKIERILKIVALNYDFDDATTIDIEAAFSQLNVNDFENSKKYFVQSKNV